MERGAWWATVHGVTKSWTQLRDFHFTATLLLGFPGDASGKEPPTNAGDMRDLGLIPGLGRSPGGQDGNTFQYSCLENPMD